MLVRTPFDDTYRPAYRQVSRVVGAEGLRFSCGQLDTNGDGLVQSPGDIVAQTRRSMRLLFDALSQAGTQPHSLAHLQVFYRNAGDIEPSHFDDLVRSCLPPDCQPVILITPIASFPKGVEVEVDGISSTRRARMNRTSSANGLAVVVSADDFFVAKTSAPRVSADAIPEALNDLLDALQPQGLKLSDVCMIRFYCPDLDSKPDTIERQLAQRFEAHPPAYTRLPLFERSDLAPLFCIELVGVRNRSERPAGGSHSLDGRSTPAVWQLPYPDVVECDPWVFVSGQLALDERSVLQCPGDAIGQTQAVMQRINRLLAGSNSSLSSAIKVNAYHQGRAELEAWTRTVQARCDFYPSPGPASTGVEVPQVGFDGAALVVDCVAVKQ